MDTNIHLNAATTAVTPPSPAQERAVTTKVAKLEQGDGSATLPSDRPFVAQAVAARLEGDYADPPDEIAPPERTLRPYGVPMLPFDPTAEERVASMTDTDRSPSETVQENR